jgi:hypothetical protein
VGMVSILNGHSGDTFWLRRTNSNGHLWTLQCLGNPPAGTQRVDQFLAGVSAGSVRIAPKNQLPDGEVPLWRARPVAGMINTFTLESVALRDRGVGERFLDGRTQNGSVGLAASTEPPFTGTRWEVSPQPDPLGDHSHE